jgi:hypothetical protein
VRCFPLDHFGFDRDVAEALALTGDEGRKIGNGTNCRAGSLCGTTRAASELMRVYLPALASNENPVGEGVATATKATPA